MTPEQINRAFMWPQAGGLPTPQRGSALYKDDPLLRGLEELITNRRAWAPISGSTKRTETTAKLNLWIQQQLTQKETIAQRQRIRFDASLDIESFPRVPEKPDTRVISTSKNIAYLIDSSADFLNIIESSFGIARRRNAECLLSPELGVFVYVSNSIESGGRAFKGDPFTGQVAAYSRIFAFDLFGNRVLNFVPYYPHQLYSQFISRSAATLQNKGVRMLRTQANLIVTSGGILFNPALWEVML
jgi:hypothetical protein